MTICCGTIKTANLAYNQYSNLEINLNKISTLETTSLLRTFTFINLTDLLSKNVFSFHNTFGTFTKIENKKYADKDCKIFKSLTIILNNKSNQWIN